MNSIPRWVMMATGHSLVNVNRCPRLFQTGSMRSILKGFGLDAPSRREVLRAGGLGLGLYGLGLPGLLHARDRAAPMPLPALSASTFDRAKACILLFMWG